MAKYKRRVVYMSDDEWGALDKEAYERRTTISALIRGRLRGGVGGSEPGGGEPSGGPPQAPPSEAPAPRAARGMPYVQPFTPVPKPSQTGRR